jgi:hypothetical protein
VYALITQSKSSPKVRALQHERLQYYEQEVAFDSTFVNLSRRKITVQQGKKLAYLVDDNVRDLVESGALTSMPGTAFQHPQRDTVCNIRKTGGARDVTFEADRVTDDWAIGASWSGRVAKLDCNSLGQGDSGDTPWFGAVNLAVLPARKMVLKDECRKLSGFAAEPRSMRVHNVCEQRTIPFHHWEQELEMFPR